MKSGKRKLKNSRGSVLVLTALMLTMLVGIAALAIDIGYLSTTKNELQNTADAAALGGAGYIGAFLLNLPQAQRSTYAFDRADIVKEVQDVAVLNKASGLGVSISDNVTDIKIGTWNPTRPNPFTGDLGDIDPLPQGLGSTYIRPTAVSVIARRDSTANSAISTFFAGIFGVNDMPVTALAIASLSGPGTMAQGELITPFGLSEHVFEEYCNEFIEFSPTTASCAAWHNFFDPVNASKMESKLLGFIEGDETDDGSCKHCDDCYDCDGGLRILPSGPNWLATNFDINNAQYPDEEVTPAVTANVDSFNFQGGAVASLFNGGYLDVDYNGATGTVMGQDSKPAPILALFDYFKYRDDDGDDTIWTATVPVYQDPTVQDETNDTPECDNANDTRLIKGFAIIEVHQPNPPPATNLEVKVTCTFDVLAARGGGGPFGGPMGAVPQLVK